MVPKHLLSIVSHLLFQQKYHFSSCKVEWVEPEGTQHYSDWDCLHFFGFDNGKKTGGNRLP